MLLLTFTNYFLARYLLCKLHSTSIHNKQITLTHTDLLCIYVSFSSPDPLSLKNDGKYLWPNSSTCLFADACFQSFLCSALFLRIASATACSKARTFASFECKWHLIFQWCYKWNAHSSIYSLNSNKIHIRASISKVKDQIVLAYLLVFRICLLPKVIASWNSDRKWTMYKWWFREIERRKNSSQARDIREFIGSRNLNLNKYSTFLLNTT